MAVICSILTPQQPIIKIKTLGRPSNSEGSYFIIFYNINYSYFLIIPLNQKLQ